MTLEELRQYILGALDKAIGIRDEQRMMANTAKRVGGDLVDIVEILRTLFSDYLDQALRTFDDVEFQKLVLRESFKTADFIPGVLGAGTGMVGTEDFTTGKLTVRNYMEVMALAIAQVFWRGGQDVYSPSGMKVNKVEEYDDYWRCYMETSKGQKNTCTVGAQMRCNKYGDGKKKYYWNLVTSTGENYIDLSKTDRDGVDVPEVGDELAQFGHRTDPNLSWILVISSMPEDAGMTMYAGVDSYTLSGKWAIRVGKDPNGSNRVGIFTKNGEFSDVIEGLEDKVDGIQIGVRNLFLNSGTEVKNSSYNIVNYVTSIDLVTGGKYTLVLRGTTTGGQQLGMWANSGNGKIVLLKANMNDEVVFAHVTLPTINESYKRKIDFYNYPSSGATANPATIKWACLYEGHIKPPLDWVQAPEDIDKAIQNAIAKTVDITAPSQVFKYEAAYTGTPTPASILLTARPRNFTPTSYQWQFLNGSTWTNISGATSSTYSVAPGNTTLFPPGVYTRTFRCVCNGDEKLSDNFTLAKLADGATGQPGAAGKGVKSTVVTYQASTSGTTTPTGTWLASIPPVAAGSYLWSKTEITYTDNSRSTMYSVARMGTNGTNGNAGNGVSGTVVMYQASTSGTTAPTGTWSNTIPPVSAGSFLWTKTVISYTNGTSSTIYSVGKMGSTGAAGKDAYTILLTNEAHTVACDANGNPLLGELAKAKTKITAYKGTSKLAAVHSGATTGQFYVVSLTSVGGSFQLNGNDEITCTAMNADTASYTCKVYLESTSFYVEKTFIVTKAKSGENYWKTDVWLDASSYDADKWIPFTGTALQRMGYNRICVSVALNSGIKPAWSTHASGFSVDFDFDMQASGWGTTDAQTLIYADTFKFCPESPASCGQMTYSSIPVLYLRGGGKYHVKTDFPVTWTPRPDGYTWTSGSYTQSVSPQTSRPKPVGTSIIGRGVRSVTNKYAVSSSNTTAPTSWSDTVPSTTTTNRYLWNYEIITYTDGMTAETNKRVIGVHGATGDTGVGIKSITEYYLASASASGVTTSTSGWTTGMQVTTTTKKYLWNYEIVTYTDNSKYTSTPVIIGTHGATGDKGDTGAAGKGVKSTAIAYQASSSGTTTPTGTWSGSIPAVAAGQYLWTRTIITYTDSTTSTMYSVGRMGTNGTNGNAGNGVSSTTITYQASTSGTTAPTGTWSSSIPTVAAGSYLWTRTIISYTNGTSSTIYSVGKMGNTGAQGVPGESINGKMLYKDPEFKLGWNGVNKYSNSAADVKAKLVVERIAKPSDAPTQSGYCLKITCKAAQSPGYGGVYQSITSRANAVFVQKIIAKIPVGYKINTASNSMGAGYSDTWLTPTEGTGKYTTYLRKVVCGATGTFSAGGHVYITGNPAPSESIPLEWYIASMTCFDQTSDGYADIEIVTKDSFAVQLGFTSFEALKANALTKGPLIKAGLINADVIDVNTLAANDALVDKLRTNILKANVITANMLSVAGFTFADNKIIGGKDFGTGAGIKITSIAAEKSFKAYKDASNYISMFYNSDSDWGLKGVVGGAELLKLGITNKIGPFTIEGSWLRGSNLALSGSQLNFSYSGHQVYVGSHPDMTTAGNAKLGTFMLSGGGYGGLGSNKQVALIAGAPNNVNSYAMAVTQGMLKMFPNASIVSGVYRAYMTGSNPGITLGNEHPNFICLYGTGNRKKINLYAGMEIGKHFIITSEASQGFDILCTGSEKFYRNGNTYVAVQSRGQDSVLVMKVDTYKWTACQMPINWLGTWNP